MTLGVIVIHTYTYIIYYIIIYLILLYIIHTYTILPPVLLFLSYSLPILPSHLFPLTISSIPSPLLFPSSIKESYLLTLPNHSPNHQFSTSPSLISLNSHSLPSPLYNLFQRQSIFEGIHIYKRNTSALIHSIRVGVYSRILIFQTHLRITQGQFDPACFIGVDG